MSVFQKCANDYAKLGFIPMTFSIFYQEKKIKKIPNNSDWTKITKETWKDKIKGENIGTLTGKKSGIMVLDIDNKDDTLEEFKKLEEKHGKIDTVEAETISGGRHLFFNYDEKCLIPNATKVLKIDDKILNIDFRTTGGCVVLPPTKFKGEKYKWISSPFENDIIDMPNWIYKYLISRDELFNGYR